VFTHPCMHLCMRECVHAYCACVNVFTCLLAWVLWVPVQIFQIGTEIISGAVDPVSVGMPPLVQSCLRRCRFAEAGCVC